MQLTHDDIRSLFKGKGLKVTPQRVAIYKALAETTCHPTASDLYHQVARDYPMISPNTVYYTLSTLREAGMVKEVNYWHDQARFDANVTPHHHLICLGCRAIVDIENRALNRLTSSSAIPQEFQVIEGSGVRREASPAAFDTLSQSWLPKVSMAMIPQR